MRYMLLIYGEESLWERWSLGGLIPPPDGGAGLQPVATATTLRRDRGALRISDGPVVDADEVLGECRVIECDNLDQAIAIAAAVPGLEVGFAVEIRPLRPRCISASSIGVSTDISSRA
jgi:hypothetical protein